VRSATLIAWGSLSLSGCDGPPDIPGADCSRGGRNAEQASDAKSGLSSPAKRWVLAQAKTGSAPLFEPPAAVPWINDTMAPAKVEDRESESRGAKTYQVNNAVSRFVVSKSRGHAAGRSSSQDAPGRIFSRRSPTCDIGSLGNIIQL
jgi:hypothetical protein